MSSYYQPGQTPDSYSRLIEELDSIPISTRGPLLKHSSHIGGGVAVDIKDFVGNVREEQLGLPLCIFIIDPQSDRSSRFLVELRPFVEDTDSIWLVPPKGRFPTDLKFDRGVELDLKNETDEKLYATLVADIVFVPGEQADIGGIRDWFMRAGRLVVDGLGGHTNEVVDVAINQLELNTYRKEAIGRYLNILAAG